MVLVSDDPGATLARLSDRQLRGPPNGREEAGLAVPVCGQHVAGQRQPLRQEIPGRVKCRLSAFPDQLAFMEHVGVAMPSAFSRARVDAIGALNVDAMVPMRGAGGSGGGGSVGGECVVVFHRFHLRGGLSCCGV